MNDNLFCGAKIMKQMILLPYFTKKTQPNYFFLQIFDYC